MVDHNLLNIAHGTAFNVGSDVVVIAHILPTYQHLNKRGKSWLDVCPVLMLEDFLEPTEVVLPDDLALVGRVDSDKRVPDKSYARMTGEDLWKKWERVDCYALADTCHQREQPQAQEVR